MELAGEEEERREKNLPSFRNWEAIFLLLEIEELKEWGGELQEGQEKLGDAGEGKEGVKAKQGSWTLF